MRRIIYKGNTRTSDEVIRREMRQFENTWYSQAAIDRSKIRLQRLGYFEGVDVEVQPCRQQRPGGPGVQRQETTSGSFVFGLGYSQLSASPPRCSCRRTTSWAAATGYRWKHSAAAT